MHIPFRTSNRSNKCLTQCHIGRRRAKCEEDDLLFSQCLNPDVKDQRWLGEYVMAVVEDPGWLQCFPGLRGSLTGDQ